MIARFCPHCGTEELSDYLFCPKCGTRLPEIADTTPAPERKGVEAKSLVHPSQTPSKKAGNEPPTPVSTSLTIVCPTCGFENPIGTRACLSCGASLKGSVRHGSELEVPTRAVDRELAKDSKREPVRPPLDEGTPKKEKRKEPKSDVTSGLPIKKRFHLDTIQVVTIFAALLLGAVLVYGLVTTKSTPPPQDNNAGGNVQQQQPANQPNADVLQAIDRLRQVVDKNPTDLASTLRLSNMLQDNEFYDQAVVYYKRYLDKVPDNVDARVDYGVTLFESGHTEEAIAQINQGLKLDPKHQIGYFNLGIVYLNAGDFEKANSAFRKCVSLDSNSDLGKKAEQALEQHANLKN